jgi:hypothetical protein
VKQFRLALKRFIVSNSFYSLDEYFDINWKWVMFCFTEYTAPCKMACWFLILELLLYFNLYKVSLLYITYTYWHKVFTNFICIYCMLLFFSCIIGEMTISISCKRFTKNKWMNESCSSSSSSSNSSSSSCSIVWWSQQ